MPLRQVGAKIPTWAVIAGITLAGVVVVVLGTSRYGATVTADSVSYLSTARHLATDGSFVRFNGRPYIHWPPLLPMVLSLRAPSLEGAAVTARWLNLACYAGIVAVSGLLLHRLVSRRWLAAVGTAGVAASLPLVRVASSVWSEPLFILLCLLALWALEAARAPGARLGPAVVAGAFAGLAMLTRYAGCLLVLAGAVALLVPVRSVTRTRMAATAAFVTVACIPTAVWLLSQLDAFRGPYGYRADSTTGLDVLVQRAVGTGTRWLLPPSLPPAVRGVVVVAALAAVGGLAWRGRGRATDAGSRARARARARAAVPYALFVLVYVVGILAAQAIKSLDDPGSRTLAPVVVPLVLVALLVVEAALDGSSPRARLAVVAGLGGILLYQVVAVAGLTTPGEQRRLAGFEGPRWTQSALLARLDSVPPGPDVVTNEPAGVYYRTGRVIALLRNRPVPGPVTLVWFGATSDAGLGPLRRLYDLEPVLVVADGGVFRITPRSPG